MCAAEMWPKLSWMRCRYSMRRSARRGESPSSSRTSASGCGSTWRPLGFDRAPRRFSDDVSIACCFMHACRRERCARGSRSVQKIAVLVDVRGEVQRVLTHQPLGELGVALFEGFDDAHMVDDRA